MDNYHLVDRLMDIVDEIDGVDCRTNIRRQGLRDLLINNGQDHLSYPGQALIEELYVAIFYEEPETTI